MKQIQTSLAERIREVREDRYGEYGTQFLADDFGMRKGMGQLSTGV